MQFLIVVVLLAIVASLGNALFVMASGRDDSKRMVRSLTVRIVLSIALFVLLFISWRLGLIEPHGVGGR